MKDKFYKAFFIYICIVAIYPIGWMGVEYKYTGNFLHYLKVNNTEVKQILSDKVPRNIRLFRAKSSDKEASGHLFKRYVIAFGI